MRLWKKKLTPKKPGDTSWSISTKVVQIPEDTFVKSRTNKTPIIQVVKSIFAWFRNYFHTVGWLFLGGIVTVLLFVLFATPVFFLKPDKIEIVLKPEPVFDKNAVLSILRDFSGKNIFALSTNDIFIALAENIRHIASVEKTLILPDGIRVTITSFPASYRAFIGEEKFLLTENGQLIPDIPEVEAPVLQIYHLVQDSNIGKKTPISDTDMYGIRIILNAWGEYLATIPIDELKFYEQEKEFHIISHGTRIIFSLENGALQIELLKKLINQGDVIPSSLLYIDTRMTNRIYVCPLAEKACQKNIHSIYGN